MKEITGEVISAAVARLCIEANQKLPEDVRACIRGCRAREPWPVAQEVLDQIIANFELAESQQVPICQDTGMACVFLEIGRDLHLEGDIYAAVDEGVRRGYRE
ncbi:MAG: fumarate hydratase, partial [Treponema sp.]|nr:fumarate hydratase [Treponema sp.]